MAVNGSLGLDKLGSCDRERLLDMIGDVPENVEMSCFSNRSSRGLYATKAKTKDNEQEGGEE